MEKNRFLKIIIVILLIINMGTLTLLFITRGDGNHPHPGEEGPAKFIIDQLGFNDQQIAQFNGLKSEHQQQMRQLQDSIRIQRDKLPDIIIEGNNSRADSVSGIIGNYQKQIEFNTYSHFVKVRTICNAEQKNKFKNIIQEILQMMGPRKGPPHR